MLGRLKMTIEECIEAYLSLSSKVFEKKSHRVSITGKVQARFDTAALEQAVKQVLVKHGHTEDALLMDSLDAACKVFVCATSKQTQDIVCLTSYISPRRGVHLLNSTRIWEACRATSAATSFFDPITIGPYDEEFVDGALGFNNPVYALWSEAQDLWGAGQLHKNLGCLISIGTGKSALLPFPDDILHIGRSLMAIATETESTAEQFHRDKSDLDADGRYYRFNVAHGLENVGLEESKKKKEIAASTGRYIASQDVFKQMKACATNLSNKGRLASDPNLENPFLQVLRFAGSKTALHEASAKGDADSALSLFKSGADVEVQDARGFTPLQVAVQKNKTQVVEVLINHGAKIESRNLFLAKPPLHLAIIGGHEIMVRLLLDKGADVEGEDSTNSTALCLAAQRGQENLVSLLLTKGADTEAKDICGKSPLYWAALRGHEKAVLQILQQGADTDSTDQNGDTPLEIARKMRRGPVIKLLSRWQSKKA